MSAARFAALIAACVIAATPAVAQRKVLRVAFPAGEQGFDPQRVYDRYSRTCSSLSSPTTISRGP